MTKKNSVIAPVAVETAVVAPVSQVEATIAKRGTEYKATNKAGYLRALLTAIQADFNNGVDVKYVSQCDSYFDIASGKSRENRVGVEQGAPNSRRMVRALVSQELALLCAKTVGERLATAKPGSAAFLKLAAMPKDLVIQIIQDGSTAFDSTMNKIVGNDKDELYQFAKWFRDASAQSWSTKTAPESIPVSQSEIEKQDSEVAAE